MRLKTKLVLRPRALTFAIVLVLSALFVGELLRQRMEQTATNNDVLAHQVLPDDAAGGGDGAARASTGGPDQTRRLHAAVTDALRSYQPLANVDEGYRAVLRPRCRT